MVTVYRIATKLDKYCDLYMFLQIASPFGLRYPKKERNVNNSHLSALKQKHTDLESRLEQEENRPMPDETLLHALKKQKLALKDEMSREAEPA